MSSVESEHFDWDELSDLFGDGKTEHQRKDWLALDPGRCADARINSTALAVLSATLLGMLF